MFPDNPIAQLAMVAFKALCTVVVVSCFMFTMYAVGPAFESRFFPVVSKLQVMAVEEMEDGKTAVHAAFKKIRECEYIGISWFVGDRKKEFERIPIVLLRQEDDTSSPNRPLGYQRAGPWIISASPSDFQKRSFAILSHRCHGFWTSVTEFYP